MTFHRLTIPTYFGGLPAGYDYANNATSGVPAVIDAPRASGPNAGTYLVGFAENALSKATNRGLAAAIENTDILDNYVHRDLASPDVITGSTAGLPLATITVPGPLWVGAIGTPNTVAGIRTFITLVDSFDGEIFSGTVCEVTAISGATPGGEWSTGNIDLTISPAIPPSTDYRVYFYKRSNVAGVDQDALTKFRKSYFYHGGVNWADGTPNPATPIVGQLDKMLVDLSVVAGAARIGAAAQAGSPLALVDGSVQGQLVDLLGQANTNAAGIVSEAAARAAAVTAETDARLLVADTPLDTLAILTAIAVPTDNLVRTVVDHGVFVFDSASVASNRTNFVLTPDDATPGRWVNTVSGIVDVASGLATLDASSQLQVLGTGWPTFTAGTRTRIRMVSLQNAWFTRGVVGGVLDLSTAMYADFTPYGGAVGGSVASSYDFNHAKVKFLLAPTTTATQGFQLCLDQYVHDGATLLQVNVRASPDNSHGSLPTNQWAVGMFRRGPTYTTSYDPLHSGGYFIPSGQLTVGDYNSTQTVTITFDQNNVVDTEQYSYYLQIWNEWGSNTQTGLVVESVELTIIDIADMRFP